MLNLKNISKLFLAAFVLSATVTLPRLAAAAEIDCSGKEGYALQICEQQKALADKNAKSNQKAEEKAAKTTTKAVEKGKKTEAKQREKYAEANKEYGAANKKALAAEEVVNSSSAELKKQQAAKTAAQKKMTDALKKGDTAAAEQARKEMAAATTAANLAQESLDTASKNLKQATKDRDKAEKASEKASEKAYNAQQKAIEKDKKAEIKAAAKQEKTASKDAAKAQKEIDKLEKACQKNPDKCDTGALQAAYAKKEAADALAKEAQKKREDVDGTTAAREAAEELERQKKMAEIQALSGEEEGPVEEELEAYDCMDSTTGQSCTLSASNQTTCICKYRNVPVDAGASSKGGTDGASEKLDKNGNPVSQQRCYEASKSGVFDMIACKAMTTLADLRVIVYTLAGFGLIAFAFGAIFNKISWKHLAHLSFALFLLSMMTPFIEYFTQKDGTALKYGNYLPAGFSSVSGSAEGTCKGNNSAGYECPDVNVVAEDLSWKKEKWSWKDLKNTVKSGISAAKKGYDTYKTVKSTVETVASQAQKIGTAIKNHEGGLSGMMDTIGEISTASSTIVNSAKLGTSAVVNNVGSISSDVKQAGMTTKQVEKYKENDQKIAELEKKIAAGNIKGDALDQAKDELERRKKTAESGKSKVAEWSQTKGKEVVDKVNNAAKTAGTVNKVATSATNAAQQGQTMGGDGLGAIFGIATAAGEGIGAVQDSKQAKIDEANAQKAAEEKKAADAKRQEEIRANNASYSQGKQWDNSFNATSSGKSSTKAKADAAKPSDKPETKPTTPTSTQKSPSGLPNLRDNNAPNGVVTTPTHSYYDPVQDALDKQSGRGNSETQTKPAATGSKTTTSSSKKKTSSTSSKSTTKVRTDAAYKDWVKKNERALKGDCFMGSYSKDFPKEACKEYGYKTPED